MNILKGIASWLTSPFFGVDVRRKDGTHIFGFRMPVYLLIAADIALLAVLAIIIWRRWPA